MCTSFSNACKLEFLNDIKLRLSASLYVDANFSTAQQALIQCYEAYWDLHAVLLNIEDEVIDLTEVKHLHRRIFNALAMQEGVRLALVERLCKRR
jgi:hypothetical protein